MSNGFVKVDGVQKNIVAGYAKVDGVWKTVTTISDKVDGVWKEAWKNAFPRPSFLTYPNSIARGQTITWTTETITGANYEYQVSYDSGKTWSSSVFSASYTGNYAISTSTSLTAFQMRIRAVKPVTHDSQSSWLTGVNVSLNSQTLATPTGLSYPSSISRGDKIRIYWNVADTSITYNVHVFYTDGSSSSSEGNVYTAKLSKTGQTYFDYSVTTDTTKKTIQIGVYGQKTGFYDSPMQKGTVLTIKGQKLGTVPSMNVPSIQQGTTVAISWGAVTNATKYLVEVIYDTQTTYTQAYLGASRSFYFTFPTNHTTVQFRVKATAPNYTDGDYHYAWSQAVKMTSPPVKTTTWKATATHNWRPNFGGQWDSNNTNMYQGVWTDGTGTWGNYKSIALFDYQSIRNALAGKTIKTVKLYFYRISTPHGSYSNQPVQLYTHNYASRPSGEPALWNATGEVGSYGLGDGVWIVVDNSIAERLRDGTAAGIAMYQPGGLHYMIFSTNVQLYVEYQ